MSRRFAALALHAAALAGFGSPAPALLAASARPAEAAAAPKVPVEQPAPAGFKDGVPVGLYFMTRYWGATGSLEKAAWYFAPDGTVYRQLEHGFSAADLAAHAGRKGSCRVEGKALHVTWADGKTTKSNLERSASGTGFAWDTGIFTAVKPFKEASELSGSFEGGESLSVGASRAAVAKRLELRTDGTFTWSGVSFLSSKSDTTQISVGNTGGGSTGTWRIDNYSLVLTDANGVAYRRIAFPYDDEKTPLKPDRIFFGGLMYKKQ